jgi:hypothetical protein
MVNEPVNGSPAGDIAPRRAFFVRVLRVLALVVVVLDTFPETRWSANVAGVSSPDKGGPSR